MCQHPDCFHVVLGKRGGSASLGQVTHGGEKAELPFSKVLDVATRVVAAFPDHDTASMSLSHAEPPGDASCPVDGNLGMEQQAEALKELFTELDTDMQPMPVRGGVASPVLWVCKHHTELLEDRHRQALALPRRPLRPVYRVALVFINYEYQLYNGRNVDLNIGGEVKEYNKAFKERATVDLYVIVTNQTGQQMETRLEKEAEVCPSAVSGADD